MLLIQNGRVLDPWTGTDAQLDVLIGNDGVIAKIAEKIDAPADCKIFDAAGLTVSPGFVDGHVHFRDPGQTQKEDVLTGAAAAAAGGYATVICMANTVPTCDTPEIIHYVTDKAKNCPVQVLQAGAVTKGLKGEEMTDFDALLAAGAPCLTDDGINLTSAGLCRRAMVEAAKRDVILSFHEEEPSLVPSPGVNYGSEPAKKFGVTGEKAEAETSMIARDIPLALDTGARVLFQHVSSGQSAALIRAGKALGAKIYAEVTPHHLSLTEDDVPAHGTCARMNPPLRREADRQALIEARADGTIDMIATDHAPHSAQEKAKGLAGSAMGIVGLETAFPVLYTHLVRTGVLTLDKLVELMAVNPRKRFGFPLRADDYAVWDLNTCYRIAPAQFCSMGKSTPFAGQTVYGRCVRNVCGGAVVWQDAQV